MHSKPSNDHKLITALALAALTVTLAFLLQGHMGLNLWDEGYLWYGAQRVLLGEVPLLNFMAYDPARYYWSAGFMYLLGDMGISPLRLSLAACQWLGLSVAIYLIIDTLKQKQLSFLVLSTLILFLWMYPNYKQFDITASIILIAALSSLIQKPSPIRYLLCGICIGFIAIIGRNHGVYGLTAAIGVIVWLNATTLFSKQTFHKVGLWMAGILIGFSPIFLMMLLIPDFTKAFIDSILFLFEVQATNLSKPVPWPWLVEFNPSHFVPSIRSLFIGLGFIALPLFAICAICWLVVSKVQNKTVPASFIAAAFLGVPYTHYAFSRPDVAHLALSIFPLLIGCLTLFSRVSRWRLPLTLMLFIISFLIMHTSLPAWHCHLRKACTEVKLADTQLKISPYTAKHIALLQRLEKEHLSAEQTFMASPFWPGAYALLEKKSPVRDIYSLLPRSTSFQADEIKRLKAAKPGFILLLDMKLDGRRGFFVKNNPLIFNYITNNYELIKDPAPSVFQIFIPKNQHQ